MRILVLRGGALGDFLVTLPALRLLRARWPKARIELAGNAAAAELGTLDGVLTAAHSQHQARWSALYGSQPLSPAFVDWLAGFDLVVNYWPDPDGSLGRHFPVRPDQRFLAGSAAPTVAPAARHYCEPLRALGLATNDFQSRLRLETLGDVRPGTLDLRPVTSDPGLVTAIHPGSGSLRKNWPGDRWIELIRRIEHPVLLVLGGAETAFIEDLRRRLPVLPGLHLADRLPLPALAAALGHCRLFLGHDSGVSHLAAAVGTPCLLLFGPTDPAMWAPPGDHVRVIRRGDSLDAISVDEVRAGVAGLPSR